MTIRARTQIAGPIALATTLIVAVATILYGNAVKLDEDARLVAHTHDVIGQLERTLSTVKDAETGQRGFLLTGEDRYLGPYHAAVAEVGRDVERLKSLTADNAGQQRRIAPIEATIRARLDRLRGDIELRRRGGFDAARRSVTNGEGKALMDDLRRRVREMADEEERLLDGREADLRAASRAIKVAYLASLAVIAALHWTLARYFRSRDRAEAAVREQRKWFEVTLTSIGDAVVATDALGRVTFINPVAGTLCGWGAGEAIGRPLPEVFRIVNEATRAPVENPVEKVLESGHVVGLANHTVLIARDGTERPIEDSAAPIKGDGGEIRGVVLVFHDVTEKRAAARELATSEEFNRRVVASSPDCLKVLDLDGHLVSMNENGCRLMEIDDLASFLGRGWAEFWPEGSREQVEDSLAAARSGRVASFRGHAPTAKGAMRWWDVSVSPVLDAGGRPVQVLSVSRDVTDRVEAEAEMAELRRQEQAAQDRAVRILESVTDAFFAVDHDWRFTYLNPHAEPQLRRERGELSGKVMWEEFPQALGTKFEREYRAAVAERRAVTFEEYYPEPLDAWFEVHGYPSEEGLSVYFRDVTDRKRSEEARERRAGQLQRLAEASARINAARDLESVVGVATEEARGLIGARRAATSLDLDPEHAQPPNVVTVARDLSPGAEPPEVDGRLLREAILLGHGLIRLAPAEVGTGPRWGTFGGVVLVEPGENGWLAPPLVGRDGRGFGLLQLADGLDGEFTEEDEAILAQLSRLAAIAIENARLNEELRENDRRKDEFLAMLAHELRNPLSAIGNAVGLATRGGLQQHIDWSMDVIARQMKHLTRLIDDLMDASRISRGRIELRTTVLDATPILASAAATVKPLADERKHRIELEIDRGNLWVEADATRLEQVVVNLLNNAAKYSENAGTIRLSARNEGAEVVIRVRDEGVGIPPEKLPQMFELFAQGDRSLARSEGGLGIGLTVVKKLVELHGGTVGATSEGPGSGSEFAIRLPAAGRAAGPDPGASPPAPRGRSRILVVDDNVDTARGLARLLRLHDHDVAVAHAGPEALELAGEHRPEFILLDIGLPGMDGYEVAARLRGDDRCRGAVIIAISGYGQEDDRRRSAAAGIDHHLVKPVDFDSLIALLGAAAGPR